MSSQKLLSQNSSPFLNEDSDDSLISPPISTKRGIIRPHGSHKWHWSKFGLNPCHAVLAVIFTLFGFLLAHIGRSEPKWHGQDSDLVFSPARDAVTYEHQTIDVRFKNSYTDYVGTPSKKIDDAWNKLMQFMNLRVQADDLAAINRTSVALHDDEGGFLVTLDVHHQIHCLNMLRQQLSGTAYYPNAGGPTRAARRSHANHCIESLRRVILCHADATLVTYTWLDNDDTRPGLDFVVDRQCRSWDELTRWTAAHSIPVERLREPLLRNPRRGQEERSP